MRGTRLPAILVAGILIAGIASAARAADDEPHAWHATFTPFVWAAGLYGDVTILGRDAELDENFIDLLDQTDTLVGLQGHLEVSRGPLGVFGDFFYVKTEVENAGSTGIEVSTRMWFIEFGAQYRLLDTRDERVPGFTVDLYGGGRYTFLELDLDSPGQPSLNQSRDWIDPIVGGRIGMHLSPRVFLLVSGDVGGFGVGSDFAWALMGLVGYKWQTGTVEWALLGGYRALGQDYTSGSGARRFRWDTTLHGPVLGLSIRF